MSVVKPVTAGSGPERYSLYAALFPAEIHRVTGFTRDDGSPFEFPLLGGRATVSSNDGYWLLRVYDWGSYDEAHMAFGHLYDTLARLVTHHRVSLDLRGLDSVDFGPNENDWIRDRWPVEVYSPWHPRSPQTDAGIYPHGWYILPEHKRVVNYPLVVGTEIRDFTPQLLQSANTPIAPERREEHWTDNRLHLALQLISEANAQRSPRLELLNVVRALEVLASAYEVPSVLASMIERWSAELDLLANAEGETPLADASRSLRQRLLHLREESISQSLKRLADQTCPCDATHPHFKKPDDPRKAMSEVYEVRSQLTHAGAVSAGKGKGAQERVQDAAAVARYLSTCATAARLLPVRRE